MLNPSCRYIQAAVACLVAVALPASPTGAVGVRADQMKAPQLQTRDAWQTWSYQGDDEEYGPSYTITCLAQSRTGAVTGRIAFGIQDELNFYAVDLTPESVACSRVEAGLVTPLGEWAADDLDWRRGVTLEVVRRPGVIVVGAQGRAVIRAYDSAFELGRVAFGSRAESVSYRDVRVQPVDEIYLADDFMKAEGELGDWEAVTSSWEVSSLPNPTRSINAFTLAGTASRQPALIVAGYPFWDNYTMAVSVRAPKEVEGERAVGVVFYRREGDYYLFRWLPHNARRPQCQLLYRRNGSEELLAEAWGGFVGGEWYRVAVTVEHDAVAVAVDDNIVLTATAPGLLGGQVGLLAETSKPVLFDDVEVTPHVGFHEGFTTLVGGWQTRGGIWRVADGAVTATGSGRRVGGVAMDDIDVTAQVSHLLRGAAGVAFHYHDEGNYYAAILDAGHRKLSLQRVVSGQRSTLAEAGWFSPTTQAELRVVYDRGHMSMEVDGITWLEGWDTELPEGRLALWTEKSDGVRFGHVRAHELARRQRKPIYTIHQVFAREKSMENWSAAQSDWLEGVDSGAQTTHWHRADIYGDCTVEADVPDLPVEGGMSIFLAAESGQPGSGYAFCVDNNGSELRLALQRQGETVATRSLPPTVKPHRFAARRAGRYIVGYVNGEPALVFADDSALAGLSVGYAASEGVQVDPAGVRVFADNVYTYAFKRSIVDWIPGAGSWEVTNRWECDPRWSFFSGLSEQTAVLWNKRRFTGDFTLEFCAAPKMQRAKEQGNGRYSYASDLNATICADGHDLNSGYSFVFGGWHNTKTAILRKDEVVAETTETVIPSRTTSIHRMWFYIKIQKRGHHLRYWIDNKLVLEYEDPEPLTGKRLGIWTRQNGIMVARVRISAHDGRQLVLTTQPLDSAPPKVYEVAQLAPK